MVNNEHINEFYNKLYLSKGQEALAKNQSLTFLDNADRLAFEIFHKNGFSTPEEKKNYIQMRKEKDKENEEFLQREIDFIQKENEETLKDIKQAEEALETYLKEEKEIPKPTKKRNFTKIQLFQNHWSRRSSKRVEISKYRPRRLTMTGSTGDNFSFCPSFLSNSSVNPGEPQNMNNTKKEKKVFTSILRKERGSVNYFPISSNKLFGKKEHRNSVSSPRLKPSQSCSNLENTYHKLKSIFSHCLRDDNGKIRSLVDPFLKSKNISHSSVKYSKESFLRSLENLKAKVQSTSVPKFVGKMNLDELPKITKDHIENEKRVDESINEFDVSFVKCLLSPKFK